ncbi:hypothetical protein BDZ97DRAFT_854933 [Flammula alnicola]|nr:hypothetical protein BDZ97DRAFT_854933 [Flammula alnicola]
MQEHMNFWIKNFYRAHGSAASWAWLEMIAPCVNILRDLGRNFKKMLGTDIGTAHHPMDLSVDLPDLMESLEEHEVYMFKNGRYLDEDDLPATDIISAGLNDLLNGKTSPLNEYNAAFTRLQTRRRLIPLVNGQGTDSLDITPPTSTLPVCATIPSEAIQQPAENDPDTDESESSDGEDSDAINEDTDSENEDDGDPEIDDEDIGEFLRSFEDTTEDSSLCLNSAADVSLDMDAEDLGLDEDVFDDDNEAMMSESDDDEALGDDELGSENIFMHV